MNPPLGGANAIWSGYVEGGGRGVESPWPLSARGAGLFSVTLKGPERACAADIKVHTGPVIVSATLGFGSRSGWGRSPRRRAVPAGFTRRTLPSSAPQSSTTASARLPARAGWSHAEVIDKEAVG